MHEKRRRSTTELQTGRSYLELQATGTRLPSSYATVPLSLYQGIILRLPHQHSSPKTDRASRYHVFGGMAFFTCHYISSAVHGCY
jgi:hypothetical protein